MEKLVKQIIDRYSRPRLRSWPKNWALKLLSLFFALFLWYFVVGEDKVDMTVLIPVEIVNLPHNLVISNQFKKELEVTVSGPRGLIRGISSQDVSRSVNLSKATPGTEVIHNELDSIRFPRGIRVLRIQPANIILLLDRLIQKELTIKYITRGSPAKNYELVSILLDPPSITLTGPQALLGNEDFLTTTPIDISGLNGPSLRQVSLDLKSSIANLIGESVVTARVSIKEKTAKKNIPSVPVKPTQADEGFTYILSPRTVKVQAELPLSTIRNTKKLQTLFNAEVQAGSLSVGRHELKVEIKPLEQGRVMKISPENVTIEVRESKPPLKP
ncbi:MAG: CdaR family protein [Thermodesulfobacteriota bacterium]|nr:CdaR family protein [Thermodesulfobacteriota bacterium]